MDTTLPLAATLALVGLLALGLRREHRRARRGEAAVADLEVARGALERVNRELTEAARLKSDFLSVVSHELRTPLASIRSAVDLVRRGHAGALAPDQGRLLDLASRNCDRLRHLIDDLLDLSKIEARRLEVRFARVELEPLLDDLGTGLRERAEEAGIALEIEAAPGLPAVWADARRLEQVLANLLGNALKFTPEGGRVALSAHAVDGSVELSVADTGIGIAAENRGRVFEPFFQVEEALTRSAGGSGLGLSIARQLVEAHGGHLDLASEPGRGSRFTFRVLAHTPAAEEATAFEGELHRHLIHPYVGLLLLRLPEPPPDGVTIDAALGALADTARTFLPRPGDRLVPRPALAAVALILPGTPSDGAAVVRRRLEAALAGTVARAGDTPLPRPEIAGPACYPEDGRTGWQLLTAIGRRDGCRELDSSGGTIHV